MARLIIHVEGETEEDFVNEVLRAYLIQSGFADVSARKFRKRGGSVRPWATVRKNIVDHLKQDGGSSATILVDYYGMLKDWPCRSGKPPATTIDKADRIEAALAEDVTKVMGVKFDKRRFIPFVMMHEFEALLFSDCAATCRAIGHPECEAELQSIRNQFACPEDINDSVETAPSKRIASLIPRYNKRLFGMFAANEIGIDRIRAACPLFNRWIDRLVAVPQ